MSTENYRLQIAKKYGVSNEEGVREYLKIFNCTDEAMRDTIPSLTVEQNKTPRNPSIHEGCEVFLSRFEI